MQVPLGATLAHVFPVSVNLPLSAVPARVAPTFNAFSVVDVFWNCKITVEFVGTLTVVAVKGLRTAWGAALTITFAFIVGVFEPEM